MFDIAEGAGALAVTQRADHAPRLGATCRPAAPPAERQRHRILVVEESLLVADSIRDSLQEHGYAVVGPTVSVQGAAALARTADLDGAVLDLQLGRDDICLMIATVLKARGIPYVIVTGCAASLRPPGLEPAAWIAKPMAPAALTEAVARMLASPSPSANRAGAPASKAGGVRILLIEGDPETRAKLAAVLAKQGFDVQSLGEYRPPLHPAAQNGERARPTEKIVCGKLVIDLAQRRAWWEGVEVHLTAGELAIVVLLVNHAGSCVDNRTVYDSLHYKGFLSGQGEKGFWVNVRSAIRRIRNKFRAVDSNFAELENSRAFGYRWRTPS